MQLGKLPQIALLLLVTGSLWAADNLQQNAKAMVASVARQQQAVVLMKKSLETQRQAVRKQIGQQSQSFFLLPPPTPLPGSGVVPFLMTVSACRPLPGFQVDALVGEAATRENVEPALLRSVIEQESGFRPCAVSDKGAMGLMQLMPATAAQFGVRNPFDPQQNVDGGARFLKQLLGMYSGDLSLALGAYNAGPARVQEAGGVPNIQETLDYVRKVLSLVPTAQ